jgi:hypothetical protein
MVKIPLLNGFPDLLSQIPERKMKRKNNAVPVILKSVMLILTPLTI